MKCNYIFLLFLLLNSSNVIGFELYSISKSEGLRHGDSIEIRSTRDTDFGLRRDPSGLNKECAPLRWGTFEDGVIGASVTTTNYWEKRSVAEALFNNDTLRNTNTTKNVKVRHASAQNPGGWFYKNEIGFNSTGTAYVNMWVYCNFITGDDSWQLKLWRANSDGNDHSSLPRVVHTNIASGNNPLKESQHWLTCYDADGTGQSLINYKNTINTKTWINISFAWQASDVDKANGNIYFWTSSTLSGTAILTDQFTNIQTRSKDNDVNIDALALGYLMADGGISALSYYDNVYIDNSLARVEIGDDPDYNECTIREIQIPTSWPSHINDFHHGIKITVNQGSFPNGSNAYLFVVNKDGVVSTYKDKNGIPIKF